MLRIGRYIVCFGRYYWLQTHGPTRAKKFLFMTIYKEAHPSDVDKVQQFPLGTPMQYEGRVYHYFRKAGDDIKKGELVENHNEKVVEPKREGKCGLI